MAKFILMFAGGEAGEETPASESDKAVYGEIGKWFDDHTKAGLIVGGEQLQHRRTAKTVRFKNGSPIVTDGPYMEAKELIGGFAVVSAPDIKRAIELAKTWPGRSDVEVRPLVEFPE